MTHRESNAGGARSRRSFLTAAAAGAAALAGGRTLRAVERIVPRARPFTMAVIGDSIMWGQGLADSQKFWHQTRDWLAHELRVPVTHHFLAHSGARIQPYPYLDAQAPMYGEIPSPAPSVVKQAQLVPNPADVDFVLLDGGANDVGLMNALSPDVGPDWIATNMQAKCGERMKALLCWLVGHFPNAQFAVTGYYPLVSAQSFAAMNVIVQLVQIVFGLPPVAAQAYAAGRDALLAKSYAFSNDSARWLKWAVDETNALFPDRVVFAKPDIDGDRCFGASDTHIWGLFANDPVRARRNAECEVTGRNTILDFETMQSGVNYDPVCPHASVMHPNEKGSAKYYQALIAELPKFLPAWKARVA